MSITEEEIKHFFSLPNPSNGLPTFNVQRVKKIRNFAFVHYFTADEAQEAFLHFQSILNIGREMTLSSIIWLFPFTDADLSNTMLNEADQELEIKWAKNRPSSPLSTSPSSKSPKTSESTFVNSHSESSEMTSEPNECFLFSKLGFSKPDPTVLSLPLMDPYYLPDCNDDRFDTFSNLDPFMYSCAKIIST